MKVSKKPTTKNILQKMRKSFLMSNAYTNASQILINFDIITIIIIIFTV